MSLTAKVFILEGVRVSDDPSTGNAKTVAPDLVPEFVRDQLVNREVVNRQGVACITIDYGNGYGERWTYETVEVTR